MASPTERCHQCGRKVNATFRLTHKCPRPARADTREDFLAAQVVAKLLKKRGAPSE